MARGRSLWVFGIVLVCFVVNVPSIISSPLLSKNENGTETVRRTRNIIGYLVKFFIQKEEEEGVNFNLYTNVNPEIPFSLKNNLTNLKESPFKKNQSMKIIIHGWKGYGDWLNITRNTYLAVGDYNIIIVDWNVISCSNYLSAIVSLRKVGEKIAELIEFLNINGYINLKDVHIVGHSLGAHIAGFAGSILKGEIGRITGLDPAGVLFEFSNSTNEYERLDSSDAKFVDVIHTSGENVGFSRAIGHVDFYPNEGISPQPGCMIIDSVICSHSRAREFMVESILSPKAFIATRCDSWVEYFLNKCTNENTTFMGENVDSKSRGKFFLETNGKSPFGKSLQNMN